MNFKKIGLSPSNINLLLSYIELIEARTLHIKPMEAKIYISVSPQDKEFAKYKIQIREVFKLVKMGGSVCPKREFAIIQNDKGERIKLVKKDSHYRLIFDDGSYFENKAGRYMFMMREMDHLGEQESQGQGIQVQESQQAHEMDSDDPKTPNIFSPLIQPLIDLTLDSKEMNLDVTSSEMLGFYSERLPTSPERSFSASGLFLSSARGDTSFSTAKILLASAPELTHQPLSSKVRVEST